MIKIYGNCALTFAIASSGGGAAFLTSSTVMNDGRSGVACSMKWDTGAQTTGTTVTITVTIASPLDATAPIGGVGLVNVTGLPAGLKCAVNGVDQVLTAGARDELSAWWLPSMSASNTLTITIKNDNGTTHPVTAGATFGIGEIIVGRALTLPTLVGASQPMSDLQDPTAFQRTNGGQLWQLMRKPYRQLQAQLGPFSAADCFGKSTSTIVSGSNPAGKIDVVTLRDYISTSRVVAVCDAPSSGSGGGTLTNGIRYNQTFMQANWMLARPVNIGQIVRSLDPYYTWSPTYMEAT